jgi:competence ComEA-like helix-hairpin-helix protein
MRSTLKNYLSLTKKDWNGLVVLLILIVLILTAPYILQLNHKDSTINPKQFNNALQVLERAKKSQSADQPTFYKKALLGTIIDLNTADTTQLTQLHGIGASFAKRIVSYRDRLGGFINKEQLKEVFGLDSEKYAGLQAQVKVDAGHIRKIDINKATFDSLSRFPYLSYKQMNAIVQFREQHGEYASLDDMRNIAILNDEILRKIGPYLVFK